MNANLAQVLASAGLLFCVACAGSRASLGGDRGRVPSPAPAFSGATPSDAGGMTFARFLGPIPVRLAPWEGSEAVTIAGTRRGTVTIERAAAVLRATTGAAAAQLHFRPAPGRSLTLDERPYPGTLSVELRPEGGLSITNLVPLEDYVSGVLAGELILWSAEPAELEAQAIAARTYALSMLARRRDPATAFLWSDTRDQAYRGAFVPEDSDGSRRVARRLAAAVERTAGSVLIKGGRLLDARFHATCGGRTAALHEQFPASPGPPIEAVACAPCATRARAPESGAAGAGHSARPVTWSTTIPARDLVSLAGELELGRRILSLRPTDLSPAGRWLSIELTGTRGRTTITLEEFRRRLGSRQVASAWITATWPHPGKPISAGLLLRGRGRGHGVGLCQTGSHDRAVQGWPATRILTHYYPGSLVKGISSSQLSASGHVPRIADDLASAPSSPTPERQSAPPSQAPSGQAENPTPRG